MADFNAFVRSIGSVKSVSILAGAANVDLVARARNDVGAGIVEEGVRKFVAAVSFLVITGVLPADAGRGVCAAKPCCHSHEPGRAAVASPSGCCSEANCSTAPPRDLTRVARDVSLHSPLTGHIAAAVVTPVRTLLTPERIAIHPGSPPIQRRLATLSILLI